LGEWGASIIVIIAIAVLLVITIGIAFHSPIEAVDELAEGNACDPDVSQTGPLGVGLDLDEFVKLLFDARLVAFVAFLILREFAFEAFVLSFKLFSTGFEAVDPCL